MSSPLVSVCIVTYQHAKFIKQTIEGVLNQETVFPTEILIGEDDSSDGTREICQEFANTYPERIRLFLRRREDVIRIGGHETGRHNFLATLREAKGRYVALCDGDDYWTDPTKLARQIELLEANSKLAICFHETLRLSIDGSLEPLCGFSDGLEFQRGDLVTSNFIPSTSVVFRRPPDWSILSDIGDAITGDWILYLQLAQFGGIKYINRPMAVYRQHEGGTWQSRTTADRTAAIAKIETQVRSLLPTDHQGLQEIWRQEQNKVKWLQQESKYWKEKAIGATEAYNESKLFEGQVAELNQWNRDLESTIKKLNEQLEAVNDEYKKLQAQNTERNSAIEWLEQERKKWEIAAHEAASHFENNKNTVLQLTKLIDKNRVLEETIQGLTEQLVAAELKYTQSQMGKSEIAMRLEEAETELAKTQTELGMQSEHLQMARNDLDRAIRELEQTQLEINPQPKRLFSKNNGLAGFPDKLASKLHVLDRLCSTWLKPVVPVGGNIYFDQILDDTSCGERIYNGWYFRPGVGQSSLRVIHTNSHDVTVYSATILPRPDVAAAFPDEPGAQNAGFEFRIPITTGINSLEIQFLDDANWKTFRRDFTRGKAQPSNDEHRPSTSDYRPTIGFVIPCYNQGEFVGEAITSVLRQTWFDLEVVVINDGSTDPAVASALSSFPPDPRLRIINQSNQGLARTRNIGIESCSAEWICCLDADDYIDPTYAEKCLMMLALTGTDICGCWQQNFGEDDALLKPGRFSVGDLWWENRMINAAVFRRRIWKQSGGYDPTMNVGYEDWQFWLRCANHGARATLVTEPLFFYRKHGPSMIDRAQAQHPELVERIRQSDSGIKATFNLLSPPQPRPLPSLMRHSNIPETDQPTVLLVVPFLVLGGVDSLLCQLGSHLTDRGFRFTVCSTDPHGDDMGDSTLAYARFTRDIHQLPHFLPREAWSNYLDHLIESRGIDTIWMAGSEFLYHSLPRLHRRYPYLKVFDQIFNTLGHTTNNRRYAHHIETTMVENQEVYEWLVAKGEWPERIACIPNGVDTRTFTPREKARDILPARSSDKFIVGFFGRFASEKGPDLLLEVARKALYKIPQIHFILGGTGPQLKLVTDAIENPPLAPAADYVGVINTQEWLPACDVIILTSRLDGRPNVVMEAMACGVPVVAFNVGGIAEMITDGESGYVVSSGKSDEMVDRLVLLHQEAEKRAQMGRKSRELAIRNFNIESMIEHVSTVLCTRWPEKPADLISPRSKS